MISVAAWFENERGQFYRPAGYRDNHATTHFKENKDIYMRVFDSYDYPYIKDIDWGALPMAVKRFWVKKKIKEQKLSWFTRLKNSIKNWWRQIWE